MKEYPDVLGEDETLTRICAGASIARYGDGEFKMIRGGSIKSQDYHPDLAKRLAEVLEESGACMVGIPNLRSETPKARFWAGYEHCKKHLNPARRYVSAFVSRPDSAPWIDTASYWDRLESLWAGRNVTLVRGSTKSLTAEDLIGAGVVTEIICPRQHAFVEYESIMERIGKPERAILCLGPTATVMAVDLCRKGVQALDLGHVGMFLKKHRRGLPMWVTEHDKTAIT